MHYDLVIVGTYINTINNCNNSKKNDDNNVTIVIIIMIFSLSVKSNYPHPTQRHLHAQSINKTIINKVNLLMFPGSLFLSLITATTTIKYKITNKYKIHYTLLFIIHLPFNGETKLALVKLANLPPKWYPATTNSQVGSFVSHTARLGVNLFLRTSIFRLNLTRPLTQ